MADASVILRAGEVSPVFASATAESGTLTIAGQPTYVLTDADAAEEDSGNATGSAGSGTATVRVWKTLGPLEAGVYILTLAFQATGSDGITRAYRSEVEVTVVAVPEPAAGVATVLLPPSLYDSVRKAIDITLDRTALPDAVIGLSIYARAAETWVVQQDAAARTRTGSELRAAQDACVYYCASLLCAVVPQVTREEVRDWSEQRRAFDPAVRAAELRGLASSALASYLETDSTPAPPRMFALACGRRGR